MTSQAPVIVHQPQPGPQTKFAQCKADICFFGGEAGGGKTRGAIYEALKWVKWPNYQAVVFRRRSVDLTGSGSIWEEAKPILRAFGATLREGNTLDARWEDSNSMIQFAHINQESDVEYWQGKQIALAIFDEVTHFTEKQFWYIYTRLRSECGIDPYIRATCNPDPDSFVAKLIEWWIDQETGYPIPERDGVLRWACRLGDEIKWFDTETECKQFLVSVDDLDQRPISITFIRSRLSDNPALEAKNPGYRGQIAFQDKITRERLGKGNWKITARSGGMFDRTWFDIIDELPHHSQWSKVVRGWDKAATKPNPQNEDPDWTRGVQGIYLKNGQLVIADMVSLRDAPGHVDNLVASTAKLDGPKCVQAFWIDPGQAGIVDETHTGDLLRKKCPNVRVAFEQATKDKISYAKPFSAFCDPEANEGIHRVKLLRAAWNSVFLSELEHFPKPKGVDGKNIHDDITDACSRMFLEVQKSRTGMADRLKLLAGARP